jgi:putative lipoprotein
MRALILVLALVACSQPAPSSPTENTPAVGAETALAAMPSWDNARAAGVDFRGVGQEPGWMLDIYQRDQIRLVWDYGENSATFALPEPSYPQEGATRYEAQADGRTITITIRRAPCQDVMSGEAFPATVEVVIDDRTLSGCGRSV